MSTTCPLDIDALLTVASGEAESETRSHVAGCEPCRRRVGELQAFLTTVRDELLEQRPECPTPEELAQLPPGAEHDDPHLRQCPLCRQEVRMLFDLESAQRLGTESADLPMGGPFYRPSPVIQGGTFAYQRSTGQAELLLESGRQGSFEVAGALVALRCEGSELIVRVEGSPRTALVLVLNNDLLEKQIPLTSTELRVPKDGWGRASVESSES